MRKYVCFERGIQSIHNALIMRLLKYTLLLISWLVCVPDITAQDGSPGLGIEDVIVEIYHIAEGGDETDSFGQTLPEGMVTYRIFLDMKEGYVLHALYGVDGHPLIFKTTTQFYNHIDWGAATGTEVSNRRIDRYGVAFDSWLSMGGATRRHLGIPLVADPDGSVLPFASHEPRDGLIEHTDIPSLLEYGIDLDMFDEASNQGVFFTEDGALAVLGGVKGTNEKNQVLIAQLTTDGQISFELNVQVSNPHCGTENYVARNPKGKEIHAACLIYPGN